MRTNIKYYFENDHGQRKRKILFYLNLARSKNRTDFLASPFVQITNVGTSSTTRYLAVYINVF